MNILSDSQLAALTVEEIDELIERLAEARRNRRASEIKALLAQLLEREGVRDAETLSMPTWDWDNGWFPDFTEAKVRLSDWSWVPVRIDSDDPLAQLITAEARAIGLGRSSRIQVSVSYGFVAVD
jgi:hypothetical protein